MHTLLGDGYGVAPSSHNVRCARASGVGVGGLTCACAMHPRLQIAVMAPSSNISCVAAAVWRLLLCVCSVFTPSWRAGTPWGP